MDKEKVVKIPSQQLIELLKDISYLEDIKDENSISRKLITHKIIENSVGIIYIPYLILLAILLCASTEKMKATAFADLFKREQSTKIPRSEVLLVEYVEKLQEISFALLIKLHA